MFPLNQLLASTLLASGFHQVSGDSWAVYLQPCPLGTFSDFSSSEKSGCKTCPPGILHV